MARLNKSALGIQYGKLRELEPGLTRAAYAEMLGVSPLELVGLEGPLAIRAASKEVEVVKDESELYKGILRELALGAQDERVKFQAASYMLEEELGRHDKKKEADISAARLEDFQRAITGALEHIYGKDALVDVEEVQ
jgi:hypothetical protein